jgi:hypothetical protein
MESSRHRASDGMTFPDYRLRGQRRVLVSGSLMKLTAVFAAGLVSGILIGVYWPRPASESEPGGVGQSTARQEPSTEERAGDAAARPRPAARAGDAAGFDRRLRAALAVPPPAAGALPVAAASGNAATRIREWAAGSGIPEHDLERELARNGPGDPLLAGSSFDTWVRGRLDPAGLAAWEAVQRDHAGDLLEKRVSTVLSGLQRAVPLSPEEKDALFDALGEELLPEELDQIGRGDWPQGEEAGRRIAAWEEKLAPLVSATRREDLKAWLEDELPGFWEAEATGE